MSSMAKRRVGTPSASAHCRVCAGGTRPRPDSYLRDERIVLKPDPVCQFPLGEAGLLAQSAQPAASLLPELMNIVMLDMLMLLFEHDPYSKWENTEKGQ